MKIAIIGAGNMGGAIARGLAANSDKLQCVVSVANRSPQKLTQLKTEFPQIEVTTDPVAAAVGASVIILAVKPWVIPDTINRLYDSFDPEHQIMVSIAGGISLTDLGEMLGAKASGAIFRVIPDTAISVGCGMTFVSSAGATEAQVKLVKGLFEAMGEVAVIEERLMGAGTALSSCGIAYVYKYVQACVQAGVQLGFYPADALRYTITTIEGAMRMLRDNGTLPQQEIDRVTTPGGMTIRGINALESSGFTASVIDAILKPLSKS